MEHFYNSAFTFFVIEYLCLCFLGTGIFWLIFFHVLDFLFPPNAKQFFLLYPGHFKHCYVVVGHFKILWRIFLLAGNQSSFLQAIISDQPLVHCGSWNSVKFSKSLQCYLDLSHMCTILLPVWYVGSDLT